MSRLKLLVVAVLIAGAGGFYLSSGAQRNVEKIRNQASAQLQTASAALGPSLKQAASSQLAAVKALAADAEIGQAFDDANKPTSAALEVAVSALGKLPADAPKPELLAIISGGAAARYRVGAANRFDKDDAAFKAVGPLGDPRAIVANLDGELFQVAVASLATTGDPLPPPVGQVVLGWALDEPFARRLAAQAGAGVGVTLVAGKKIVASTLPPAEKKALPTAIRPGAPVDFGSLEGDRFALLPGLPVHLPLGATGVAASRALAIPLAGDASAVLSVHVSEGFADLASDQRGLLLGIVGLALLCLLLALVGTNPTKGLAEVAAIADKIAQGDHSLRAPTEKVAPGVRRLAVAINAIAASAGTRASSPSATKPPPSIDELLQGAAVPQPPAEEPKPTITEPAFSMPRAEEPPPPRRVEPEPRKPELRPLEPMPVAKMTPPPPKTGRSEDDFGGIFDSQPPPSVPKTVPPAPPPAASVPSPFLPDDADAFNPDATVVAQVPEALVRATRANTASLAATKPGMPMAVPLPPPPANAEESHFQAVFREFVATREKCGEAADGLTYDKFVAKLRKNKEQLVAKYNCKSVRFQVYVKEGKAALKATPVRE
jgi:hypothetical protein